jgi:hypothetical protein
MTNLDKILVAIQKLDDSVQGMCRRFEDLKRQMETMDQDRAILESMQLAVRNLEAAEKLHEEHIDNALKDIKLEIQVVGARTEGSVEKVHDKVEKQVGDLVDNISKKEVVLVKEKFVDRVKKFFNKGVK